MATPVSFGKYLLLERISVGGMAEIFQAKAVGAGGFEKLVAIKRILPSMAEDRGFIEMFIDEAKIAGQLTHANVCQIFELGCISESHFIAMEYVSGKDLFQVQNRIRHLKAGMAPAMAAYIASKVCEGIDYAHRKRDSQGRPLGIIHRDVSPQNVIVSYEGEIKLIDFGIAKAVGKSSRTQVGALKGKLGYMSPEQVRGIAVDRRSDLFAVGTLLYELLAGRRLFVGENDFAVLEKVRSVDILSPRALNSKVPESLDRIVMRALARDPDDRYAWASDMQEALQAFLMLQDPVFTAKHLSEWMKETFALDLRRERLQLERYTRMGRESAEPNVKVQQVQAVQPETGATAAAEPEPRRRIRTPYDATQLSGAPMGQTETIAETGSHAQPSHAQASHASASLASARLPRMAPSFDPDPTLIEHEPRFVDASQLPAAPNFSDAADPADLLDAPLDAPPRQAAGKAGARGVTYSPDLLADPEPADFDDAENLPTRVFNDPGLDAGALAPIEGAPLGPVPGAGEPSRDAEAVPEEVPHPQLHRSQSESLWPEGGAKSETRPELGMAPMPTPPPSRPPPTSGVPMVPGTRIPLPPWMMDSVPAPSSRARAYPRPRRWGRLAVTCSLVVIVAAGLFVGRRILHRRETMPAILLVAVTTPHSARVVVHGGGRAWQSAIDRDRPATFSGLTPGEYEVAVAAEGVEPYRKQISLRAGDTEVVMAAVASPQPATLHLKLRPQDASAWIDGSEVPAQDPIALRAGKHDLRIAKEGYAEERLSIEARGGEKIDRAIDLQVVAAAPPPPKVKLRERALAAAAPPPAAVTPTQKTPTPTLMPTPTPTPTKTPRGNSSGAVKGTPATAATGDDSALPKPSAPRPSSATADRDADGFLLAKTQPAARVEIDGTDTGQSTPLTQQSKVALKPGFHIVTFVIGNRKFDYEVRVRAGEDVRLNQKLDTGN